MNVPDQVSFGDVISSADASELPLEAWTLDELDRCEEFVFGRAVWAGREELGG